GTAAGSIFGHPAVPSVVAVGAVDVHDPGLDDVELFSSRGPARIDFPTLEIRAKPDLVAFDGVAISNAGGFPACPPFCAFFGTSAAPPHSAAAARLFLRPAPDADTRAGADRADTGRRRHRSTGVRHREWLRPARRAGLRRDVDQHDHHVDHAPDDHLDELDQYDVVHVDDALDLDVDLHVD